MVARTITRERVVKARPEESDKRQAIVEAARSLFTTKGYETTTIAEVARQAGVAVGTVYLYFKNKNDLLFAVKGDWEDEFIQFLAQPELQVVPHHLRARPLVEACFKLCEQHRDVIQLMGLQPEMIGDWHEEDQGKIAMAVKAFFDEAVALGAFRPMDTYAASIIAFGMVDYALRQCFVAERGKNRERYINTLVDAFEQWLVKPELLAERTNRDPKTVQA
jgi:TetR/AcrR family fatty acid metabolism transcriptional regulator